VSSAVTTAKFPVPPIPAELARIPLVSNNRSPGWISDRVCSIVEGPTPWWWWVAFIPSVLALGMLGLMLAWQISTGVGVWGNNHPVMWGWDIINFVWWIGIGHAGTLISAILFLLRQRWRTAVNRAAEAMTIFAVMCAGIYPGMHVGRVWYDWWLFPIPNSYGIWPQFKSPLMWDVFAVSTYFTVSLLFWYVGLVPDLAILRDRAKSKVRQFAYGFFSLGWTGSNRHWSNYEKAYLILAASRRRWCSPSTRSCHWTSPCRNCPAGTPPSSRLTSWPAPSSPVSAWCSAC
jgi:molybdopterin-containing oxidoreductase family membrane subunit